MQHGMQAIYSLMGAPLTPVDINDASISAALVFISLFT